MPDKTDDSKEQTKVQNLPVQDPKKKPNFASLGDLNLDQSTLSKSRKKVIESLHSLSAKNLKHISPTEAREILGFVNKEFELKQTNPYAYKNNNKEFFNMVIKAGVSKDSASYSLNSETFLITLKRLAVTLEDRAKEAKPLHTEVRKDNTAKTKGLLWSEKHKARLKDSSNKGIKI